MKYTYIVPKYSIRIIDIYSLHKFLIRSCMPGCNKKKNVYLHEHYTGQYFFSAIIQEQSFEAFRF